MLETQVLKEPTLIALNLGGIKIYLKFFNADTSWTDKLSEAEFKEQIRSMEHASSFLIVAQ